MQILSLHLHLFDVKTLGQKVSLLLKPGVERALPPPPPELGSRGDINSSTCAQIKASGSSGRGKGGGRDGRRQKMLGKTQRDVLALLHLL